MQQQPVQIGLGQAAGPQDSQAAWFGG